MDKSNSCRNSICSCPPLRASCSPPAPPPFPPPPPRPKTTRGRLRSEMTGACPGSPAKTGDPRQHARMCVCAWCVCVCVCVCVRVCVRAHVRAPQPPARRAPGPARAGDPGRPRGAGRSAAGRRRVARGVAVAVVVVASCGGVRGFLFRFFFSSVKCNVHLF